MISLQHSTILLCPIFKPQREKNCTPRAFGVVVLVVWMGKHGWLDWLRSRRGWLKWLTDICRRSQNRGAASRRHSATRRVMETTGEAGLVGQLTPTKIVTNSIRAVGLATAKRGPKTEHRDKGTLRKLQPTYMIKTSDQPQPTNNLTSPVRYCPLLSVTIYKNSFELLSSRARYFC